MTDAESNNYRKKIDAAADRLLEVLNDNHADIVRDYEAAHGEADGAMCQFFIDIGKPEIAMAFDNVGKRYA